MNIKVCTKCGKTLPATLEFFGPHTSSRYGLNPRCRPCARADGLLWYAENTDKALECARCYREENRELLREKAREHYWENPERGRAAALGWQKNNPDHHRALNRNYKARKRQNGGRHTGEEILALMRKQNSECFYCGVDISAIYHADHFIPLAKGGANGIDNIVLSCPDCNLRKQDKHPIAFLLRR
jgi:5-methylcytosine-specific restriction endonuclease McrA